MLRTIRKRPITSIFTGLLLFMLVGVVWQWLNMARAPVVFCSFPTNYHENYCLVQLGNTLDPVKYDFIEINGANHVSSLEHIRTSDKLYRIWSDNFNRNFEELVETKWQPIDELSPDIHRWYMMARIAKDAKLQEGAGTTQ